MLLETPAPTQPTAISDLIATIRFALVLHRDFNVIIPVIAVMDFTAQLKLGMETMYARICPQVEQAALPLLVLHGSCASMEPVKRNFLIRQDLNVMLKKAHNVARD